MATADPPRRFKLASELDKTERDDAGRFGANARRVERDEYVAWRCQVLRDESDDLPLRGRLLEEQADYLRSRAADRDTIALEQLTPADWHAREAAKQSGEEPDALPVAERSKQQRAAAAELEQEAAEIAQYLAEHAEMPTTEDMQERMR